MSVNLIIADDEYFIRQRIKKIIPWERLGLTFAGEAEDGNEVMGILHSVKADILLLDIKMPKVDGITAAQHIKESFPDVHIIILSGYNDFEYARTALRYGVKDYLLKPVSAEELEDALSTVIDSILTERRQTLELELFNKYNKNLSLEDVRFGKLTWQDFCAAYPAFEEYSCCLFCALYAYEQSEISARSLMTALTDESLHCEHLQDSDYIHLFQVFLHPDCSSEEESRVFRILEDFTAQQKAYTYITQSEIFSVAGDWNTSYQLCTHSLVYRYFSPSSSVKKVSSASPAFSSSLRDDLLRLRKSLPAVLAGQNDSQLRSWADQLFADLKKDKEPELLVLTVTEIFTVYHIYFGLLSDSPSGISDFVSSLLEAEYSLNALKDEIIFYGEQCLQKVNIAPSDSALCSKVIQYIYQNYTDEAFSVAQIASHFHLNPSYLGSVFKKVNHTSLLQYISEVKVNKAKQLLTETDLKISEIAEKTGFSDVYYFSKRFKKITGFSPKEYALRHS